MDNIHNAFVAYIFILLFCDIIYKLLQQSLASIWELTFRALECHEYIVCICCKFDSSGVQEPKLKICLSSSWDGGVINIYEWFYEASKHQMINETMDKF